LEPVAELHDRHDHLSAEPAQASSEEAVLNAEDRFRRARRITDSAISHLELEDLLQLLLDEILELLSCDTAAVLLLDQASQQLIARAAKGVEEEVRQGVRVPLGVGFAGTIASERKPIILAKVDATTVTNPVLWEKGIRCMLGVPLLSSGQVLGVLHVGSFTDRAFDQDDVLLLELVAERVANAVQSGLAGSEHRAAAVLQRSLLPSALPKLAEFEFASRYAPAEHGGVGGDWYDAFVLPSGDVWVMTGDVAGHGLWPAVVMGRLRSALRSYALMGMAPEDVLQAANRKLQHFEGAATATVVCGVFAPPFDEYRFVSAGHPPPVVVESDGSVRLLPVEPAPPLGAVPELRAHSLRGSLTPGMLFFLYTDGLIERRGVSLDVGFEELCRAVRPVDPEQVCREVMDALIGSYIPADDVAVLAIGRREAATTVPSDATTTPVPSSEVSSRLFANSPSSVSDARAFVVETLTGLDARTVESTALMVSELATNAVMHGNAQFQLTLEINQDLVHVEVTDFGPGRPLSQETSFDDDHGRGMQIIRRLAHAWGVQSRPIGTGKTVWFTLGSTLAESKEGSAVAAKGGP
jgi:anti-sigma regulatory factor (Ser/Thr protein kinase)/putative methionine-R-sulfoxide reductase with GAF domain